MDGRMDGWREGWKEERMDGRKEGMMDRRVAAAGGVARTGLSGCSWKRQGVDLLLNTEQPDRVLRALQPAGATHAVTGRDDGRPNLPSS